MRPELNGNEIAETLGIKPGPVLGQAYTFLLGVRLDDGLIGKDAARDRLRAWWAERSVAPSFEANGVRSPDRCLAEV